MTTADNFSWRRRENSNSVVGMTVGKAHGVLIYLSRLGCAEYLSRRNRLRRARINEVVQFGARLSVEKWPDSEWQRRGALEPAYPRGCWPVGPIQQPQIGTDKERGRGIMTY